MTLKVISSNSSGNCYLLQSQTGTLLIECGVHISKIKKALNYNLHNVSALVTHSHGDHACSIKDVMNVGINVYAAKETFQTYMVEKHHRAKVIDAGKVYEIGSFTVKAFMVNHDVPCFGFIIFHNECGLTLFLTDTYYSNYTFPGLNNIIVECNHDVDAVYDNTPGFLRDRIFQSHMNIDTCKDLLCANDLSAVNNIVLIHLSNSNSDEVMFVNDIRNITGKNVYAAEAGLIIENFNKHAI